jgi:hypothetical protein
VRQHVERHEERRPPAEHEIREHGPACLVERDNLAVERGRLAVGAEL